MAEPDTERLADWELATTVLSCVMPMLDQVDWEALREQCNLSHVLVPILDPTAYRDGASRLRNNEAIVSATAEFVATIQRLAGSPPRPPHVGQVFVPEGDT